MENIKEIISKNLVDLRKKNKMTQSALAEKLNYSDKAISRWERGETLPDIEVLCRICDLYGVSFEYLLQREQPTDNKNPYIKPKDTVSKISITLIAMSTVWMVAALAFVYFQIYAGSTPWTLFIWAMPLTALVGWICNKLWGKKKVFSILTLSFINWTLLLALYLEALDFNIWTLFLIGIPVQSIIILSANLKKKH